MKKKILAFLLILFPIFSLGMQKAETIKIVSDTAYAPLSLKIQIKLIKELMLTLSIKSLRLKDGTFKCLILALMQL